MVVRIPNHFELAVEELRSTRASAVPVDEYVYLAGRPPLRSYLHFMETEAETKVDRRSLVEQWRAAEARVEELESEEAGWADEPDLRPPGDELEPLLRELREDPIFRNAFQNVATDVAIVELDRLVVYQKHINLTFAAVLRDRFGPVLSDEALFRACLPVDHPHPETRWMRTHGDTWVCVSPSNDLRFLDTVRLEPQQVRDYPASGPVSGVIGGVVGFGSNVLNAFHAEGRLVLNNGSHRAFALREMGVTHVPCIVQHLSSRELVTAFGSPELARRPELYLRHARPPVLKDYFDPRLRTVTRAPRRYRQVRVTVRVEQSDAPAP